jgi:hypothetical protein
MDCGRITFNSDFCFGSLSTVSAKSVGWLMSASVQNRRIPDPGQELRSRLNAESMLLADRSYDADWIQRARDEQGRVEIDGPEVSCPSGKTPTQILHPACQSSPANIFRFTEIRICRTSKSPWPETRGGSRSSRTAGWGAMDATASGVASFAGRETVSRSSRADDTALTAFSHGFEGEHTPAVGFPAKTCADGQVVWS